MRQRTLGTLTTSALGLGCMGMSEFYGETDPAAARDTLDAALEAGVTLFDTADVLVRWLACRHNGSVPIYWQAHPVSS